MKRLKSLVTEENIYNGSLQEALDEFKEIHIGKSSVGWQFLFNHNNWKYYQPTQESINDFLQREILAGGAFIDEYGEKVSLKDFWDMVESEKDGWDLKSYSQYKLKRWNDYLEHPEKYKVKYFKPSHPVDYSSHVETFSKDKWHLRFSDSTEFS